MQAKREREKEIKRREKEAKAAAAAAKAAAEAASGDAHPEEDQNPDDRKPRQRRVAKVAELTEGDPKILHDLRSSSSSVAPTTICTDVNSFVECIATVPEAPACARLKKGSLKKVLQVMVLKNRKRKHMQQHDTKITGCVNSSFLYQTF